MRVGIHLGHWERRPHDVVGLARVAESCGLDSVWVSETWGSDAVVLAASIGAGTDRVGVGTGVLQMPARTPSATAMAAITLDHLTAGRFRLGLGVSGPVVVEGWHGVPFGSTLARTREYVEIVREVLRREAPLQHDGDVYPIPRPDGSGKPLKANVVPLRTELPLYVAAMGPRNVALAAEVADGWMPFFFAPERADVFSAPLEDGFARRGGRPDGFDVAPVVPVAIGADVAACRDRIRPLLPLYVGAYGPKGGNYYHDLMVRFGFGEAADAIQEAYLSGRRSDATAAVPDEMVDAIGLVGQVERVADRLAAFAAAGTTTVIAKTQDPGTIRGVAEAAERAV
jgi:F420-dependent oxidoreductase-like protein